MEKANPFIAESISPHAESISPQHLTPLDRLVGNSNRNIMEVYEESKSNVSEWRNLSEWVISK